MTLEQERSIEKCFANFIHKETYMLSHRYINNVYSKYAYSFFIKQPQAAQLHTQRIV